jgi:hypothetical protein
MLLGHKVNVYGMKKISMLKDLDLIEIIQWVLCDIVDNS